MTEVVDPVEPRQSYRRPGYTTPEEFLAQHKRLRRTASANTPATSAAGFSRNNTTLELSSIAAETEMGDSHLDPVPRLPKASLLPRRVSSAQATPVSTPRDTQVATVSPQADTSPAPNITAQTDMVNRSAYANDFIAQRRAKEGRTTIIVARNDHKTPDRRRPPGVFKASLMGNGPVATATEQQLKTLTKSASSAIYPWLHGTSTSEMPTTVRDMNIHALLPESVQDSLSPQRKRDEAAVTDRRVRLARDGLEAAANLARLEITEAEHQGRKRLAERLGAITKAADEAAAAAVSRAEKEAKLRAEWNAKMYAQQRQSISSKETGARCGVQEEWQDETEVLRLRWSILQEAVRRLGIETEERESRATMATAFRKTPTAAVAAAPPVVEEEKPVANAAPPADDAPTPTAPPKAATAAAAFSLDAFRQWDAKQQNQNDNMTKQPAGGSAIPPLGTLAGSRRPKNGDGPLQPMAEVLSEFGSWMAEDVEPQPNGQDPERTPTVLDMWSDLQDSRVAEGMSPTSRKQYVKSLDAAAAAAEYEERIVEAATEECLEAFAVEFLEEMMSRQLR